MDLLAGPRRPRWRYTLLDRQERPLGRLDGASNGRFSSTYQALLGAELSLTIDERGQNIDWLASRLQVDYDPGIPGVNPWPLGRFVFDTPEDSYGPGRSWHDVTLLSKLAALDRSRVLSRYTLQEGVPVVPAVADLIRGAGETALSVVDSTKVLENPLTFEVGTTRVEVVNELLKGIGYEQLAVDAAGQFRVQPIRTAETPAYEFAPGPYAIHMPEYKARRDIGGVRNIWVVYGQGTEDDPPLQGIAYNRDPASPFAIQYIGESVGTTSGVEADDETTYAELARQELLRNMAVATTFNTSHAIIPVVPGDTVAFTPMGGTRKLVRVQSLSCDLTMGAHYSAEWTEVVDVALE